MFNIPIIHINMPKRIVSPNVLSVLGSPGTRQSFWGQLGQADQAAFRLCSKQARDLSNDLIHTLFLKLPCGDVQKGQVLDHEPDAAQLARLHAGSFKHAWELQVTYQSTSSRQGATDHTAQYLAHYLAVVGTLPVVRMCKINLGAQERLCMPVAAMLACMLPSIELLFINLVDYDNEPPSALLQAFKRCPRLHTVCCTMSHASEEMASVVHASAQALPNLRALGWSMQLRLCMLPGILTQLPALRTLGVSSIEPMEDENQKMEEVSTDGIDPTATSPLILALCRAGWLTFQPEWGPDGRLPVTHHVLRRLPCVSGVSGGMLLARSFPSAEQLVAAVGRLSSFARAYALQFSLSGDDVPTPSSPSSPAARYAASEAGVSGATGSSPARAGSGSEPFTTSAWWQALPPGSLRNVLNAHVQVVASPALLLSTGLAPWPRQVITHIAQALPDLLGLSIMSHMPECVVSIAHVMLPRMPHVQRLWISWARDPNDFSPAAIAALSATLMAVCHAAPSGGALRWVIALGMPEVVVRTCNKLLSVQGVGGQVRVGTDQYATPMEPMQMNGQVQMQGQTQPQAAQQLPLFQHQQVTD